MSDLDTDSDMEDLAMQMGMVDATDLDLTPIENLDERTGYVWTCKDENPAIPQDEAPLAKIRAIIEKFFVNDKKFLFGKEKTKKLLFAVLDYMKSESVQKPLEESLDDFENALKKYTREEQLLLGLKGDVDYKVFWRKDYVPEFPQVALKRAILYAIKVRLKFKGLRRMRFPESCFRIKGENLTIDDYKHSDWNGNAGNETEMVEQLGSRANFAKKIKVSDLATLGGRFRNLPPIRHDLGEYVTYLCMKDELQALMLYRNNVRFETLDILDEFGVSGDINLDNLDSDQLVELAKRLGGSMWRRLGANRVLDALNKNPDSLDTVLLSLPLVKRLERLETTPRAFLGMYSEVDHHALYAYHKQLDDLTLRMARSKDSDKWKAFLKEKKEMMAAYRDKVKAVEADERRRERVARAKKKVEKLWEKLASDPNLSDKYQRAMKRLRAAEAAKARVVLPPAWASKLYGEWDAEVWKPRLAKAEELSEKEPDQPEKEPNFDFIVFGQE